jgi:hypothetical protein
MFLNNFLIYLLNFIHLFFSLIYLMYMHLVHHVEIPVWTVHRPARKPLICTTLPSLLWNASTKNPLSNFLYSISLDQLSPVPIHTISSPPSNFTKVLSRAGAVDKKNAIWMIRRASKQLIRRMLMCTNPRASASPRTWAGGHSRYQHLACHPGTPRFTSG